jgi:hypothetical protein
MRFMNGVMWSLITVVGPLLLIVALIVVFLRNRRRPRGEIAEAERGAVQLREELLRDPQYRED